MSEFEIVKSEYNALGEDNNYKTHFFKTSADQVVGLGRMKSTAYIEGDVVFSDTNNAIALKCTTAGTTSDSELDISANSVGDSITDGGVAWSVVKRDLSADLLPVGTIIAYAGNTVPSGYLDCSGASLNPSIYANLFGVIGTTYGGDGSTTFNLPNLNNNSFLEGGSTVGTVKSAGLPNIGGYLGGFAYLVHNYMVDGAFAPRGGFSGANISITGENTGVNAQALTFNAQVYNSIFGNSDTVQPKSVTVKYCIKY